MADDPYYGGVLDAVMGPTREGPAPPPAPTGYYAPLLDSILNPHLADNPARQQAMSLERERAVAAREYSGPELFGLNRGDIGRNMVPFGGVVKRTVEDEDYKDARESFGQNKATDEELRTLARYDQEKARQASQGLGGEVARGVASIPALIGETQLGPARLLTAPKGASFLNQTGRAAASGPLIPSLVVPEAEKRSIEQGGEAYDLKNAAPAVGMAVLQNAILGTIGRQTGQVPGGFTGRVAAGGLVMPVEQAGADAVTSTIDKVLPEAYQTKTRYGAVGDLMRGDTDSFAHKVTVQAVTGAAFAAMHGRSANPAETVGPALDSLAKKGLSKEAAAKAVNDAVAGQVEPPTEAVKAHVEAMDEATQPKGDVRLDPAEAVYRVPDYKGSGEGVSAAIKELIGPFAGKWASKGMEQNDAYFKPGKVQFEFDPAHFGPEEAQASGREVLLGSNTPMYEHPALRSVRFKGEESDAGFVRLKGVVEDANAERAKAGVEPIRLEATDRSKSDESTQVTANPRAEVDRLEGLRNVSDHRLADAASRMKDANERANLLGAPQAAKDARLAAQVELSKARRERKDLQRQLDDARDAVLRQPSPAKSPQPVAEPPVEGARQPEPVQAPQEAAPEGPGRAPEPAEGEIVAPGASGGHTDPGGLGNEIEAAIRAASGGEQSFHYRDLGDGGFVKVQGSHVTFGRKSDLDHVIVSFRPNGTAVVASKMYPQDRAAYAAAQERVADSLRKAGIPTNIDGKEPPAAGGERPDLSDQESHVLEQTRMGVSGPELGEKLGVSRQRIDQILDTALAKSGEGLNKKAFRERIAEDRRNRALDLIEQRQQRHPGTNQPVVGVDLGELRNLPPKEADRALAEREGARSRDIANEDFHAKQIKTLLKEIDRAGGFDKLSADRREAITRELAVLQQREENRSRPPRQQSKDRQAAGAGAQPGNEGGATPRPGGGSTVPAPGAAGGVPQAEPAGGAGRGAGAGDPDGAGQPLPGGPRNGRAASLANLKQNRAGLRSITQLRKDGGIDPDTFIANFGRSEYDAIVQPGHPNPFVDAQGKKGRRHWEEVAAELAKDGTIKSDSWRGGEGEQTSPDANDFLALLRDNRPLAESMGSAAGQREIARREEDFWKAEQAKAEARGEKIAEPSDEPIPFFRLPWQTKPKPPGPGGTPAPSAAGPSGVVDEVRTLLAPATRSEPAKTGGNVVRANNAVLAHKKAVAEAALKAGADYFDDLVTLARGDEAKLKDNFLAFTDPIQSGAIAQMGPEMRAMAETVRKLYDERTAAVTSRKLIDSQSLIDNYITQLWADPKRPDATPEEIGRLLAGRRPLAGAEGFKKQRFYDTYRDGIEAGLVPKDWNPVRTLLAGLHQIDKSVMAHDTVHELKENGLWEFTRLGGDRKPGWEHINDKIATVFAPPEAKVKEYFDKQQMEGLEKFADSIGLDVETARDSADVVRRGMAGGLPKPVGKRGGALGASVGDTVIRRFGTPEEVLAHEIGHQLDKKYDMARGLQAPGLAGEMEALAKLRASGRVSPEYAAYLQQPGERAANLVTAYLHAPELLRKEAPLSAEWFDALIASHPELHPIRDIKPSLELTERDQMMRLAGPVLTGHFTTPGEVATLLNNHLSPGLYGRSRIYEGVRHAANTLNGFQLGFSAFHAGFVTMDTQVSAVALGLKQLSRGDFAAGLKTLAAGAVPGVAPVRSFLLGTKLGREYFAPGSQGAEIAGLVEMLEQAGGRGEMDAFHGGDRVEAFRKALRAVQLGNFGKLPHALLHAIPALAEAVQKPVMEVLVPRMKMGVFAEAARYELDRNPNMTREEFRDTLGKTWDSVENRLGQMTYDNLFWNRTFKDLLMVGVRSVGWNVGTVRELAGGVRDIPRAVRDVPAGRGVSDRLAYTAALPMVAALWGAMYGYLFGEPPTEAKDYFFPKTGRRRKDGSADRVSLPSYMRDVAALTNRGDEGPVRIAANAWSMAKHKANPLLGTVAEMLENQDFYGKAIYNPSDKSVLQARDLAAHVLKAFEPFAVRSYEQQGQQNAPLGQKLQGFVGITPAPSNVVHTAEEQRAAEAKRKVVLTPIGKLQQERKKAAGR